MDGAGDSLVCIVLMMLGKEERIGVLSRRFPLGVGAGGRQRPDHTAGGVRTRPFDRDSEVAGVGSGGQSETGTDDVGGGGMRRRKSDGRNSPSAPS